jgi:multicomponent Na+:H+ antiporter subunit F
MMVEQTALIILAVLAFGLVLSLVRAVRGPTLPDRAVALDTAMLLAVGMLANYSILTRHAAVLDAAVVLALVAFLGTIAFAYYLRRWARHG